MNYYKEIKNKLIDNEIYAKVKDYSKERNRVKTYFEIGKLLSEAGSKYGESIIEKYSEKLIIEVGKKYNVRTLRSMRQLYVMFSDDFWKPVVSKLSWTSFLLIMPLKEQNKMYYNVECVCDGEIENLEFKPELVNGYLCQNIHEYLSHLKNSEREKDKLRISLVEEYINNNEKNKSPKVINMHKRKNSN